MERAGYDPADEPIPVSPAAHYAIGGIVTDLDGPHVGARAVRRRRVRVHRRARREPARLELAARVPRLRPPRRPRGARRAALRRRGASDRPGDDAGAALWRDAGLIRSADGLARLLDSPHPLVREIAASGLAREESRGVHFREDFPVESEALAGHLVVHPGRQPELEPWS